MAINHPLPYLVSTGFYIDYEIASVEDMTQHMMLLSLKLEEALRNDGHLCSLIGHTVVGRYDLRGTFEEVLANMIYFRVELMTNNWKRNELLHMMNKMDERCMEFVRTNYYDTPAKSVADKIHDDIMKSLSEGNDDTRSKHKLKKQVLASYHQHLHKAKQCLCYAN